jgi:hypothetical protein
MTAFPDTGITHPKHIEWSVERMGNYVLLKLDGGMHSAIMPLSKGQAKSVVREINRALEKMEKGHAPDEKHRRRRPAAG